MVQERSDSWFGRARTSFVRNKDRGASVEVLRGNSGADFEGEATVVRCAGVNTSCFSCSGDKKKEKFVLLKGGACFIFSKETSNAPKYAILLEQKRAKNLTTHVQLESTLGDVQFKFSFKTKEGAEKFAKVVNEQASIAETNIVKERLGHKDKNIRASVHLAQDIAKEKQKDQPDTPMSSGELLQDIQYVY